jgi:quercetin dioxygenase-like cupin family protein
MEVLEALGDRVPERGELQRVVIFGPETGAHHVSAVLVRVPAGHEFSLHTHPRSEDCFFVLSGTGQAIEPGRSLPLAAPAAVWIPVGHPHGLAAGSTGMLEVGFQSPADPTAVPFDARQLAPANPGLLVSDLAFAARAQWVPVFPSRREAKYLDAFHAMLGPSGCVTAEARGFELVVIVASGAVELAGAARRRLDAIGALRLSPGSSIELRALQSPALLLGVRARAAEGGVG